MISSSFAMTVYPLTIAVATAACPIMLATFARWYHPDISDPSKAENKNYLEFILTASTSNKMSKIISDAIPSSKITKLEKL